MHRKRKYHRPFLYTYNTFIAILSLERPLVVINIERGREREKKRGKMYYSEPYKKNIVASKLVLWETLLCHYIGLMLSYNVPQFTSFIFPPSIFACSFLRHVMLRNSKNFLQNINKKQFFCVQEKKGIY